MSFAVLNPCYGLLPTPFGCAWQVDIKTRNIPSKTFPRLHFRGVDLSVHYHRDTKLQHDNGKDLAKLRAGGKQAKVAD
jgi:hypothetical protein